MKDFFEFSYLAEANIRSDGWTNKDFTTFKNAKLALLKKIAKYFEKHDVKWHPECGTLLGIYRDNSLMKQDNDVDIAIRAEDIKQGFFDAFNEMIEDKDLRVSRPLHKRWQEQFAEGHLIPENKWYRVFFKERTLDKAIFADIMVWFPKDDYYFCWDGKLYRQKAKDMKSFSNIVFRGINVRLPKNTESYLETEYGDDWKTPDSKWKEDKDMWYIADDDAKKELKDYKFELK